MDGGKDSFEVVKEFIMGLGDRRPQREEVAQIATALADIYQRLMRVRSIAPTVDVSDRMWELMSMVGLKAKPVRSASFRSAASFLEVRHRGRRSERVRRGEGEWVGGAWLYEREGGALRTGTLTSPGRSLAPACSLS